MLTPSRYPIMNTTVAYVRTPIGCIRVVGAERGIFQVGFVDDAAEDDALLTAAVSRCIRQIGEYFAGERTSFDSLPLAYPASDFQRAVWDAAMCVPYGETATYADIAVRIGNQDACRAVGNALNKNPLLLFIPCHRIVPTGGSKLRCGGFAGGTWRKEWLLDHEANAHSTHESVNVFSDQTGEFAR